MKTHRLPAAARPASLPLSVSFQLPTACPEPPTGEGWLYEVKHPGRRLAPVGDGPGGTRLLSRNGLDRTRRFAAAFAGLAELGHRFVIDEEIAAPDERGTFFHSGRW